MKISKDDIKIITNNLLITYQDSLNKTNVDLPQNIKDNLKAIILGKHLTFRYMLVTALTAKQSLEKINPLAVQSSSTLPGAYDARSVGHKVIVPFEKKYLTSKNIKGALGGSNEPYLNKPARVKEISLNNPVRSGNDANEQKILVQLLTNLTSKQAHAYLIYSLELLISKFNAEVEKLRLEEEKIRNRQFTQESFRLLLNNILAENDYGQSLPLVIGTTFFAVLSQFDHSSSLKINVHKVNEAGASSKEIGDIDIYENKKLIATIEAKDKQFDVADVVHASSKAYIGGLSYFYFIYRGVSISNEKKKEIEKACAKTGCKVILLEITDFLTFMYGLLHTNNLTDVEQFIIDTMHNMSATDDFYKRVMSLITDKK